MRPCQNLHDHNCPPTLYNLLTASKETSVLEDMEQVNWYHTDSLNTDGKIRVRASLKTNDEIFSVSMITLLVMTIAPSASFL